MAELVEFTCNSSADDDEVVLIFEEFFGVLVGDGLDSATRIRYRALSPDYDLDQRHQYEDVVVGGQVAFASQQIRLLEAASVASGRRPEVLGHFMRRLVAASFGLLRSLSLATLFTNTLNSGRSINDILVMKTKFNDG